jgi:predicted acetyltransferase
VPELIAPTVRLHAAWLEAHEEWGPGVHEDGAGLRSSDEVRSPSGFAAFVARAGSAPAESGGVSRWIVEGDRVLGAIALRPEFTDVVRRFGHIGYGVRPSARGRGLATWALGQMLGQARVHGLERVLIVCSAANLASARAIERNGGVLEGTGPGPRRYWIELPG